MDTPATTVSNERIADVLDQVGDLLDAQHASPYRVAAYHRAAATTRASGRELSTLLADSGRAALEELPGIGPSIASAIEELVATGQLRLLERLQGQVSPEDLFATLPGVGHGLARRLHETLGVDTLEELEVAAHGDRLQQVPGIGARRARLIRDGLEALLRRRPRRPPPPPDQRPGAELLLAVDEAYRRLASEGRLRTIAPRRFNPRREAWLPIYHSERDGWQLTAMYSNTAQAHRLAKTDDWVVIYFQRQRDGHEGQCTVVTEFRGPLSGRRVVRGREDETPSAEPRDPQVRRAIAAAAAGQR